MQPAVIALDLPFQPGVCYTDHIIRRSGSIMCVREPFKTHGKCDKTGPEQEREIWEGVCVYLR